MSRNQIEVRLARIEREIQELKKALAARETMHDWREIVGMFKDDKVFAEIARLGRQIRRRDRSM
jgi:hypothetical protein